LICRPQGRANPALPPPDPIMVGRRRNDDRSRAVHLRGLSGVGLEPVELLLPEIGEALCQFSFFSK